jgi:heme-degrading monooxygenase HmoA
MSTPSPAALAKTPEPPYYAVIFSSIRNGIDAGYDAAAERMMSLAPQQPGFLGVESVRDPATGLGITVSYWRDEASIAAWRGQNRASGRPRNGAFPVVFGIRTAGGPGGTREFQTAGFQIT